MSFAQGTAISLRETWRGRVWEARTAIVVEDARERTMLYVPPRAHKKRAAAPTGAYLRIPDRDDWILVDAQSSNRHVLSFAWPDTEHAVLMSWHAASGDFLGWYVNLQSPLRRTAVGFDATDHVLDLVVQPDRTWRRKDDHEMEDALTAGLFTEADVAHFQAERDSVIESVERGDPPFNGEWLNWKPDPTWPTPGLPAGWDEEPD